LCLDIFSSWSLVAFLVTRRAGHRLFIECSVYGGCDYLVIDVFGCVRRYLLVLTVAIDRCEEWVCCFCVCFEQTGVRE
jgi:hypothetical protein